MYNNGMASITRVRNRGGDLVGFLGLAGDMNGNLIGEPVDYRGTDVETRLDAYVRSLGERVAVAYRDLIENDRKQHLSPA